MSDEKKELNLLDTLEPVRELQTVAEAKARGAGGLYAPARSPTGSEVANEDTFSELRAIAKEATKAERDDLEANYATIDLEFGYGEHGALYANSAEEAIRFFDDQKYWLSDRLERAIEGLSSADQIDREIAANQLFMLGRESLALYARTYEDRIEKSVESSLRAQSLNEAAVGRATGDYSSTETLGERRCRLFDQYSTENPTKKAADIHRMIADAELEEQAENHRVTPYEVIEVSTGETVTGKRADKIRYADSKESYSKLVKAIKRAIWRGDKKKP
tara:strand:+ start:649 stop:1476 length:828 start_codon:yes stop_codon:yes gene_type:complete